MQTKWYTSTELIVGMSALVISLVTVGVSIYSASIDRDYARASVWPWLQFSRSFDNLNYSYSLANNGTGPAIIVWAKVAHKDVYYTTWSKMLAANNLYKASFTQSHMGSGVLPALKLTKVIETQNKETIKTLFELHNDLNVEVCYCSIYDECWLTDINNKPEPIDKCGTPPSDAFLQ
jgi:hypothetical protein